MKAIVIEQFGGPEMLHLKEVPKPTVQDGEVLIKTAYAGVNPVDRKIREGYLKDRIPHEFPTILGWDVAGTVVEAGKQVTALKVGDEVFSYVRKPLVKWGTYAEYVAFDAKDVAKKPKGLSFAEAAALPLVSLTAWQSVFDAAHLKKGETILIHGSSGGVGSMAVQFAKNAGAKVIATASLKKHEYVKKLGADLVLDYREDFVDPLKEKVDVVFDCVGGEIFKKSLSCLKKGGRIVSILEKLDPTEAKNLQITAAYVFVAPNGNQLKSIAQLIEEKKIVPLHVEEMPLKDAAEAQEKLHSGAVFGKIVLKVG
jgi:2-desacetyl-2-hydroxyethyl bacteriochlorophyllide A dehydrogenase